MKLLELKVCPKCGYSRKDQDRAPAYECPHCGIIFSKYWPPAAVTPQVQPAIKPEKKSDSQVAPGASPVSPATTVDALLLSVALGVLLEPVFGLTSLLKDLGFPGDGLLSELFGGLLASRFFAIEVGLSGTLLSIGLAAVILLALSAHRGVSLSRGRRATIAAFAFSYLGVMHAQGLSMMQWSFDRFGSNIWLEVEDATLSLTMVVFGVLVTQHLIQWSRFLQVYDTPEVSA